jgi:hypothetical protein
MASRDKRMLHLNTRVKIIEASEEYKLIVQQIVAEFNVGQTQSVRHTKSQQTSGQILVVVQ